MTAVMAASRNGPHITLGLSETSSLDGEYEDETDEMYVNSILVSILSNFAAIRLP